jgi:hypothetical protein
METRGWFAEREPERKRSGEVAGLQADQRARAMMADLFALRLGRPLGEDEEAALAERLVRLGHHRLHEAVLSFRAEVLELWLADRAAV